MAEALQPPDCIVDVPLLRRAIITNVKRNGKLLLFPSGIIFGGLEGEAIVAKIPIPNRYAHNIVWTTLAGNIFDWITINGSTLEYNIFYDSYGRNVTHLLYMYIARTLILAPSAGLPQVSKRGYCRISPLCDDDDVYVQKMPAYVDAISYVIYMSVDYQKTRGLIQPAEDIVLDGAYIFSNGIENYRVVILDTCPTMESGLSKYWLLKKRENSFSEGKCDSSVETLSSDMSLVESSRTIGGESRHNSFCWFSERSLHGNFRSKHSTKDEAVQRYLEIMKLNERRLPKEVPENKVMVSRIDFGGLPMIVERQHLYNVEDVSMELLHLHPLAFKVNIGSIFGSEDNKEDRLSVLRTRQRTILVETVSCDDVNIPPTIDILQEF